MEQIKAIHFSYLRNDAHFEYQTRYKNLLDGRPAIKSIVENYYPVFVARLGEEGALIDVMKKSDYTAQIADADHRVDRCLVGMNTAINAAMHHFDHEVVEAAQSLHNRFHAFGEIGTKSYEEEVAAVNLLLADLNADYAAKVTLVGLTPWVTELTAAEAAFELLLTERYKESSSKPQGRLTDARRAAETVYRSMIAVINAAMYMSDAPTDLSAFIKELNATIDYYNSHTHRHARKDLSVGDHTVVEPIDTQAYTERPITVIPKAYYREEGKETVQLSLGADFSVTYKNNVNVGTAELTLHGKGAYKGQFTVTFNIAR
jgi:hypothetical protein